MTATTAKHAAADAADALFTAIDILGGHAAVESVDIAFRSGQRVLVATFKRVDGTVSATDVRSA
jgi:hypothetical protein